MPPRPNARLVRIHEQARPDDWDTPGSAGALKWEPDVNAGELGVDAYYRESLVELKDGGRVTTVVRRELILDVADVDELELDTNDVLTFTIRDTDGAMLEDEHTGRAEAIPRVRQAGISRDLQTSRIVLTDA